MIDYANQFHVVDANNALSNLARQILKGVSVAELSGYARLCKPYAARLFLLKHRCKGGARTPILVKP